MPVVHSETWAAQRALTHCARFPPWDCGDGSEGRLGLLPRLSQRRLCRLASWGWDPEVLAWTPAVPEGRGWVVPWGSAEPSTAAEGKTLLWAIMLGNGVIWGSLPPPGSGLYGVLC